MSKYGMSFSRDWLYDSESIAIKVEGCVWGNVDDGEDMGCMEGSSEDGATMWYQMANCKRAQVAYSVYASSSGSTSCSKSDWEETFVTTYGVAEFAYTMGSYGYYSPLTEDDVGDLPLCEEDGNGYYMGVGCSSDGKFTLDLYTDQYCLQYYDTYQELDDLNSAMQSLSNCYNCYDAYVDEDASYSLCAYLFPESGSCSAMDSPVCKTNSFVSSQGSSSTSHIINSPLSSSGQLSFMNKLKYGGGSAMLVASAAMFVGILFANRRKRRAMLHRKFRSGGKSSRRSKSRSKRHRSGRGSTDDHAREVKNGVLT
eukprot:CAMPEP_0197837214 /NCGR_PEP_ID=MMETSP1437-20131217/31458_1 /TAXON_ID=49252 ORGANISM="Eucampia antarctica, Strain CCMP1452" /NCGR_SAMPLE_ID=MMETSP1437 /ASSEMBLY_ACC=CAM_ASM_001096 /LENGTH=311 /DNA_ID=CAMNT_0043444067 /DNA_START=341 /DNA_END=1276 /DNA_ORIENTATION=+